MPCQCSPSRHRDALDTVAFAAMLVLGLVLIGKDGFAASGLDAATYVTSLYSAWYARNYANRHHCPPRPGPQRNDGPDG